MMVVNIFLHAIFAILAIPLGLVIFLNKKGTSNHKLLGWIWIVLLVIVSISAIFIQTLNPGQYSLIHLLIPFTLVSLIHAIWSIRMFKETKKINYRYSHMYNDDWALSGSTISRWNVYTNARKNDP